MKFNVPSNAPNSLKVRVEDIRKVLPVNKKYTWITRNGVRDLNKLTTIVVHHDAIAKGKTKQYSDVELAQRISTSHIRSTHNIPGGDPGFPYHIWIRNGTIYVCNDLEAFTYGVANNNSYTIHISVSGNYAGVDSFDLKDRNALYAAILMVKLIPTVDTIKGHKEITETACPGFSMHTVREDILHIEEDMSAADESVTARAFVVANRIDQLGKRLNDPKWGASAVQKLNWLIPLQPNCATPEELVKAVMGYYVAKEYDAVLSFEPIMKERSLI